MRAYYLFVCSREYNIESTSLHTHAEVCGMLTSMRMRLRPHAAKPDASSIKVILAESFPLDSYLQTIKDMHIQHTAALSQLRACDINGNHHYTGNTGLAQVCLRYHK